MSKVQGNQFFAREGAGAEPASLGREQRIKKADSIEIRIAGFERVIYDRRHTRWPSQLRQNVLDLAS
ncbi:hypothetical protein ACE103_37135 [Bradyrhizobium sp. ma5]|uniref:hypothetical protein n=1 Tax=unclassified Bradyrhizobium TaxID=2631580 RepID=UPI001CC68EEC|nr:hypothetical protein [Bradyrhizobium sp. RD5-C2]